MCSQFGIKTSSEALKKRFGVRISEELNHYKIDKRLQGYLKTDQAPVLIWNGNDLEMRVMNWSLCPNWAKEYPFKASTYNARLERPKFKNPHENEFIFDVPSFKDSFNQGRTCLVPMNYAVESSYFGSHAGHVIKLEDEEHPLFMATGLYNDWVDRHTGEVHETFTLLTDEPDKAIYDFGHDRSLVLIDEENFQAWLSDHDKSGKQRLDWLRDHRTVVKWRAHVDRPLKDGWKRRAPSDDEIEQLKDKIWTR